MDVFVANLPKSAKAPFLVRLFHRFDNAVRFKLMEATSPDGRHFRYGIATFSSRHAAMKALKQARRHIYDGHLLEVREYFHRNYANERRALDWRTRPWSGTERRRHSRRILSAVPPPDDFSFARNLFRKQSAKREPESLRILDISGYPEFANKL